MHATCPICERRFQVIFGTKGLILCPNDHKFIPEPDGGPIDRSVVRWIHDGPGGYLDFDYAGDY